MLLMSFDPGGTTGVAHFRFEEDDLKIWTTEFTDEHHLSLWYHLEDMGPDVVVSERFNYQRRELSKGVSLELVSREYIGVFNLWCKMHRKEFVLQQPADRKMWTPANLMHCGLYDGKSLHERDALCHGLVYIARNYPQHQAYLRLLRQAKGPRG